MAESCSRIKDVNERLTLQEVEVQRIQKENFEDLYNIDTQEQVAIHICSFDGVRRGNYFGGEPIRRAEVELRMGKVKSGKALGKNEVKGKMLKGEGDRLVNWMESVQFSKFKSSIVPEDWRCVVITELLDC